MYRVEPEHALVAAALDSLGPRDNPSGYLAEYHQLIQGLLTVWAPCGCVLAINKKATFLMPCGKPICDFSWENANDALKSLQSAQDGQAPGEVRDASAILPTGPSSYVRDHPSAPVKSRSCLQIPETCQSLSGPNGPKEPLA